ncbi:hypothetical protein CEXT_343321 [Caerostris extrusa]|uniref:Uncharacterized protein n=1 Tax=Caerostris extrusa TaxID=172846 RepID=A0AAV4UGA6_CAEEX|nr:hypothetical protein CEXT_343321 [Caerostris extrusa]
MAQSSLAERSGVSIQEAPLAEHSSSPNNRGNFSTLASKEHCGFIFLMKDMINGLVSLQESLLTEHLLQHQVTLCWTF